MISFKAMFAVVSSLTVSSENIRLLAAVSRLFSRSFCLIRKVNGIGESCNTGEIAPVVDEEIQGFVQYIR